MPSQGSSFAFGLRACIVVDHCGARNVEVVGKWLAQVDGSLRTNRYHDVALRSGRADDVSLLLDTWRSLEKSGFSHRFQHR
jgi:hypothetical protein